MDRNGVDFSEDWLNAGSLSARRAWIEIRACITTTTICTASLSARRAWIEIWLSAWIAKRALGRSPQGERG